MFCLVLTVFTVYIVGVLDDVVQGSETYVGVLDDVGAHVSGEQDHRDGKACPRGE